MLGFLEVMFRGPTELPKREKEIKRVDVSPNMFSAKNNFYFIAQCSTLPRQSCSCGWGLLDEELHQSPHLPAMAGHGQTPHLPSSLPPPLPLPPPPLPDSSPGKGKEILPKTHGV